MRHRVLLALVLLPSCARKQEPPPEATKPAAPAPAPPPAGAPRIAENQNKPRSLVVDGTAVYWVNEGGLEKFKEGVAGPGIMKVAKTGGAPVKIGDGAGELYLAAGQAELFVGDREAKTVKAVPKAGGAVRIVLKDVENLSGVAVDGGDLYALASGGLDVTKTTPPSVQDGVLRIGKAEVAETGGGALWKVPAKSGKPVALVKGLPMVNGLQAHRGSLYFRTVFGGQLMRARAAGGAAVAEVVDAEPWASWLVDDRAIVWTTLDLKGPRLVSLVPAPEQKRAPAALPAPAFQLAADETHIYFVDKEGVRRMARGGAVVELMYASTGDVASLAIDKDAIYWSDILGVYRLAKPR